MTFSQGFNTSTQNKKRTHSGLTTHKSTGGSGSPSKGGGFPKNGVFKKRSLQVEEIDNLKRVVRHLEKENLKLSIEN